MEILEHPPMFRLPGIPDHVTYMWIIMAILMCIAFIASRRLELVPRGLQNLMEIVLEQFVTLLDDVLGHEGRRYVPLIATLGLFILISNLLGLVPGQISPTANINTTAACALIVFFAYHWIGARKAGLIPYLKHFAGPMLATKIFPNNVADVAFKVIMVPIYFLIEIVSHLARPLSLSLRLFGNMIGGHILLAAFFFLMGFDGMLGWALRGSWGGILLGIPADLILVVFTVGFLFPLKILVAFLQAFIFIMLSILYIAGAVEEAEHH